MVQDLKIRVGKQMREQRVKAKLTQKELAQKLLKSIETISNMERGKTMPGLYTLEKFCKITKISLHDFFKTGF